MGGGENKCCATLFTTMFDGRERERVSEWRWIFGDFGEKVDLGSNISYIYSAYFDAPFFRV